MAIEHILIFVVTLLALSLITDPLGRALRLPHTVLLVVTGFAGAHLLTLVFGFDLGLRSGSFHDLIFFVFLPVLVFDAAYHIPVRALWKNLGPILALAVFGMLTSALLCAALIYAGIGHASGFPWIAALLAGALLAATDPVATVAELRESQAPGRLAVLLEGESLFNDATAIVLFGTLITLATTPAMEAGLAANVVEFARVFFGGIIVGALLGLVGAVAIRTLPPGVSHALLLLTLAYGSFLCAEAALGVSGVMATLTAGLALAHVVQRVDAKPIGREIGFTLGTLAYAANGSVFLLVGVTVTVAMFTERWLAMLIAVAAVLVTRATVVYGGLGLLNRTLSHPVPVTHQNVMVWGGLRGAVTLALALALPTSVEGWWTIQAMAYGVVLFTLFVQAPTIPLLLRRTGLVAGGGRDS